MIDTDKQYESNNKAIQEECLTIMTKEIGITKVFEVKNLDTKKNLDNYAYIQEMKDINNIHSYD